MSDTESIIDCLTSIDREDGTLFTLNEIKRMKNLLKQINAARRELAEIQHLYSTCSVNRVSEGAERAVKLALNEIVE